MIQACCKALLFAPLIYLFFISAACDLSHSCSSAFVHKIYHSKLVLQQYQFVEFFRKSMWDQVYLHWPINSTVQGFLVRFTNIIVGWEMALLHVYVREYWQGQPGAVQGHESAYCANWQQPIPSPSKSHFSAVLGRKVCFCFTFIIPCQVFLLIQSWITFTDDKHQNWEISERSNYKWA